MEYLFTKIDKLNSSICNILNEKLFLKIEKFFSQTLNYTSLLILILGFLIGLSLAISSNSFNYFLYSISWILIGSCVFYLNKIILNVLKNNINKISLSLSNIDIWKFIYGPFILTLNILIFFSTLITGLQFKSYTPLIIFLIALLPILVYQIIYINPSVSKLSIDINQSLGKDYLYYFKFNIVVFLIRPAAIFYSYVSVGVVFIMLKILLDILSGNDFFILNNQTLLILPIFLLYPLVVWSFAMTISFFIEIFESILSLKK